ncbi:nucleoside deaminase [Telmatospirillum siberiense]|uniref:Nucleoside deaminase n=2 Tax=Telmatospirillum siberiense TaxID=382514 RepID=A0A2N3PQY1_9PROT|nr:nucleoside deaminase [Telmatospirillum siberiense]
MRLAIEQAQIGSRTGNAPIGCVVVCDGKVVAAGHNRVASDSDPTAHAEIVVIRAASLVAPGGDLGGMTLYSTLQPCGMCTMAALWANVRRIVYGASRAEVHPMYFEARHLNTRDYIQDAYRDDIALTGAVLAEDCAALYCRSTGR